MKPEIHLGAGFGCLRLLQNQSSFETALLVYETVMVSEKGLKLFS